MNLETDDRFKRHRGLWIDGCGFSRLAIEIANLLIVIAIRQSSITNLNQQSDITKVRIQHSAVSSQMAFITFPNASTTRGSNCDPLHRSNSSKASAGVIASRNTRGRVIVS